MLHRVYMWGNRTVRKKGTTTATAQNCNRPPVAEDSSLEFRHLTAETRIGLSATFQNKISHAKEGCCGVVQDPAMLSGTVGVQQDTAQAWVLRGLSRYALFCWQAKAVILRRRAT